MSKQKRNLIISGGLILLSIIYTILIKTIDVQNIGANGTAIGFATINKYVFNNIGVHMIWYHITDWLGLIPVFTAFIYTIIGVIELIKRKNIFKVDKELICLGIYYIFVIGIYVFFEKFIINYRPILMNGFLEASYPSSHTLITICLCGSAILINKKLFNCNYTKIINFLLGIISIITIIGRLISGVHWFTDIIGGLIISSAILMTFYSILKNIEKEK